MRPNCCHKHQFELLSFKSGQMITAFVVSASHPTQKLRSTARQAEPHGHGDDSNNPHRLNRTSVVNVSRRIDPRCSVRTDSLRRLMHLLRGLQPFCPRSSAASEPGTPDTHEKKKKELTPQLPQSVRRQTQPAGRG